MLPKEKRLNRTAFNRFFSAGKKRHTPHLMSVHVPNSHFHASVVVSKKIYKTATKRNKLRRRIYDILRRAQKEFSKTGIFILITKPSIVDASLQELREEITHIITHTKS